MVLMKLFFCPVDSQVIVGEGEGDAVRGRFCEEGKVGCEGFCGWCGAARLKVLIVV